MAALLCSEDDPSNVLEVLVVGLNKDEDDIVHFVENLSTDSKLFNITRSHCVLETPAGAPPGARCYRSIAVLNESVGFCKGVLSGRIGKTTANPRKWMSALDCLTKGDKNVTKNLATGLYPEIRITHRNADAILIATYCMQKELGLL